MTEISPKEHENRLRQDLFYWMENRAKLPSGKQYSFKGHEYMEQIAKHHWVPGDQLFIMKSSQCGASEYSIDWLFWMQERNLPDWQGIAYLFPATEQLRDHIKARIIPIMEMPEFSKHLKNQNLRFFRYNDRPIYFSAAQPRRDLISWSADAAVMDEFDEFGDPIAAVDTIAARFNHSRYKWILGISTPTYPDIGIDAAFAMSNQFHWFVNCLQCKAAFSPLMEVMTSDFESCVTRDDKGKAGFVCPHCHKLTQTNGTKGEWKLVNKGKSQRYAYAISRLFVGHADLDSLLDKFEDAHNMQEFYNSDLGLPYSPANARLTRGDIVDNATGEERCALGSKEPTYAGIDVGKKWHYFIAKKSPTGEKIIIAYGIVPFDDIAGILTKFNVTTLVIDLRPYEQEVKRIIRGHRGWYASDYNTSSAVDWYDFTRADIGSKGGSIRVVKNHRTQTCDYLIQQISTKKNWIFPKQAKSDNVLIKQMCASQRMEKSDKDTGEIKAYYGNGNRPDHYFHAAAFLELAFIAKRSSGFVKAGPKFH